MWPRRFSALNPPLVTLSKTEFSVDEQNLGIEICVHFLRAPRLWILIEVDICRRWSRHYVVFVHSGSCIPTNASTDKHFFFYHEEIIDRTVGQNSSWLDTFYSGIFSVPIILKLSVGRPTLYSVNAYNYFFLYIDAFSDSKNASTL